MESSIFEIGEGGVKATVYVGISPLNAFYLSMAIFVGIFLALVLSKRF
ncbi:hypothetical protein [Flavilitoribacter nigricans]|nr:hypothetical protein [Flavilitoribacter nigricans]